MPDLRLYILAGNFRQAANYARDKGLRDWRYVERMENLMGTRDIQYVVTGTFFDRPGAGLILSEAHLRGTPHA